MKKIIYKDQARKKLLSGVNQLSKAVVTTLGPLGQNVALDRPFGGPSVVHDGVTVAKDIALKDSFENMGAQLVKEAASKTNDVAGDGTTTAILLAQQIVKEGIKNISAGANGMELKKEIKEATKKVVEELDKLKKTLKKEDWVKVATISSQNEEIGKKIVEAIEMAGEDGVVEVEDGKTSELEIIHKKGMEFDKGYASPYFVTNPDKMESEIDDPVILITDQKVSTLTDLVPFLEMAVKVTKEIVLLVDEIDDKALADVVVNKLRGAFNILVVKAPEFGDKRKDVLGDIAILTGATVISADTGRKLDSVTIEDCGRAEKVWADKDATRIIGGKGEQDNIDARVASIRVEMEKAGSEFEAGQLQARLAKLVGGVAVISVGAATEVELKETQERVRDAVGATKAAIEEGIVPGGGVALLRASKAIEGYSLGAKILKKALSQPIRHLARNSGINAGEVMYRVLQSEDVNYGLNVLTSEYGNMITMGILDPVKVTKSALKNASSVATMILTTEVLVTDEKEVENKA